MGAVSCALPKTIAVLIALSAVSCSSHRAASQRLTVAAAANLTNIFAQLGPKFERETGIHPVFSFASTAQLMRQIENAAPFDVIAAADAEHVDELDRKGFLTPGTRAAYAIGVLALWIPPHSGAHVERIEDLASSDVKVIAIANPELAPYGEATVETLHHLGLWEKVKARIVYAENINMARQYGASKNADAVFTAYSLVMRDPGKVIQVDEKLHAAIVQELGVVARSPHQSEARRFTEYLLTGEGRQMLESFGYRLPAHRD